MKRSNSYMVASDDFLPMVPTAYVTVTTDMEVEMHDFKVTLLEPKGINTAVDTDEIPEDTLQQMKEDLADIAMGLMEEDIEDSEGEEQ